MKYCTVEKITRNNYHQMDNIDSDIEMLVVCFIDERLTYEFVNLPTSLKYLVFPKTGWTDNKINKYFPKIPFDCEIIKLKLISIETYEYRKGIYMYFSLPKIFKHEDFKRTHVLCTNIDISLCSIIDDGKENEFWIIFNAGNLNI